MDDFKSGVPRMAYRFYAYQSKHFYSYPFTLYIGIR